MTEAPAAPLTLTFRCPKEVDGLIPPPEPAARGLPDWLKQMPAQALSGLVAGPDDTVKRCPPFVDAMTSGFLIPLFCDVTVKDGEFTWDSDLPGGGDLSFARSPLGLHDSAQVEGTPLFDDDQFMLKFHNLWTIEAPAGYSLLFTHPVNRLDLPFTTLTGLVDCDRFRDGWINFPARWRDPTFSGVLAKARPSRSAFRSSARRGRRTSLSSPPRRRPGPGPDRRYRPRKGRLSPPLSATRAGCNPL